MTIDYFDLLSDTPLPFPKVGHIKRVKLGELRNSEDSIGLTCYNGMLFLFHATKQDIVDTVEDASTKSLLQKLIDKPDISVYDIILLLPSVRGALQESLSYFLEEGVFYDEKSHSFITYVVSDDKPDPTIVGEITRNNFDEFREVLLQTNHISFDKKQDAAVTGNNELLKKWEYAEKMNRDLQNKTDNDDNATLGNVISKLCSAGTGITFANVWDLTVYQAYDQFAQIGYLRSINISERIFTIHGGDNFEFNSWMNTLHSSDKSQKG